MQAIHDFVTLEEAKRILGFKDVSQLKRCGLEPVAKSANGYWKAYDLEAVQARRQRVQAA
jgi:hypothetical protein